MSNWNDRDSAFDLCEACHDYPCSCDNEPDYDDPLGILRADRDAEVDARLSTPDNGKPGPKQECQTCEGVGTLEPAVKDGDQGAMSEITKECPFCGGNAVVTNVRMSNHSFKVGCYNDSCWRPGTDFFDTEQGAIAAWNMRTSDRRIAELEADVERLHSALAIESENRSCSTCHTCSWESSQGSGTPEDPHRGEMICGYCKLQAEVKRLEAEANNEGPGTPMGRLNYICEFAEKELGLSPYSSRGADGALLEEFTSMKSEVAALREDQERLHAALLKAKERGGV